MRIVGAIAKKVAVEHGQNAVEAVTAVKSHKLKTDTGIELNIPFDCFQNTDYVEFVKLER